MISSQSGPGLLFPKVLFILFFRRLMNMKISVIAHKSLEIYQRV